MGPQIFQQVSVDTLKQRKGPAYRRTRQSLDKRRLSVGLGRNNEYFEPKINLVS